MDKEDIADEVGAWAELQRFLEPGEKVEAIVFGEWGYGGYNEPDPLPVPVEMVGKLLSAEEAKPFMKGWSFYGGYGAPNTYAVFVWTNKSVIWVHEYDGSTTLRSAPRHPVDGEPYMI